ncbi:DUF1837 domain-containing protein [Pseudomonas sp. B6002]|uniref:HamA C-terminal domain-containing protein n=1 Tax=Pseudomonas sp. B6002 TaxID=2726978 RepID=UPI0015A28B2E|nr:DUF1837 domain-containing protein [Pseudomonas sp. B6002]NVZ51634.1 DUF1837 domain-containing protein [Pseudomonas sp. B6002]
MDAALKTRVANQIFKFETNFTTKKTDDSSFTLDYEGGRYRQSELVGLIRDTVPFFALTSKEISSIDRSDWNKQSFTRISDANINSKGDYGELLLYLVLSVFYDVPKFVTKARLRSTTREQIKGFDCAHFSVENSKVTLWLGEAKFHKSVSGAVNSALKSLNEHLNDAEKIKSELKLLGGEIEINKKLEPEKYDLLKQYVAGGKSLDKVNIAVPVLITYDSSCIKKHCNTGIGDIEDDTLRNELESELESHFKKIYKKSWPAHKNIKIVFFAIPLESVSNLKSMIGQVEAAMKF